MTRVLVILALGFAIGYLANQGLARLQGKFRELVKEPMAGGPKQGDALVACLACGVHLPRSRALESPGGSAGLPGTTASRFYCSEDCRRGAQSTSETIRSKSA